MTTNPNKSFDGLSDKIYKKIELDKNYSDEIFDELKHDFNSISENEKKVLLEEIKKRIEGLEKLKKASQEGGLVDHRYNFDSQIKAYKRIIADMQDSKSPETKESNNYDKLFELYDDFKNDKSRAKDKKGFLFFWAYIKDKNTGFAYNQIGDIFQDLAEDKKEEVINKLKNTSKQKKDIENDSEDLEKNNKAPKELSKEEILDLKNERAKLEEEYLQLYQEHVNTKNKDEQTILQDKITKNRTRANEIDAKLVKTNTPNEEGKEKDKEDDKEKEDDKGKEDKEDMGKEIKNIDKKMEEILKLINMVDINNQYNKLSKRREKLKEHMQNFNKDGSINADTELFRAIYPALEHEINEFKKELENAIIDLQEKIRLIDGSGIADIEKVKEIRSQLDEILSKYKNIKTDFDSIYKKLLDRIYKKTPKLLPKHDEEEKPKPKPEPEPEPEPTKQEDLELSAVISDMGTDVHRERVSLETEEELRDYYKGLPWYRLDKRAYLFLSRGKKRKNMVDEKMKATEKQSFTIKNKDFDQELESAADRHSLEKDLYKLSSIVSKATVDDPQVNQLCKQYLQGSIDENTFKAEFNKITADPQTILGKALEGQKDIKYIGTNVLEKLNLQKASSKLMSDVSAQFEAYTNDKQEKHIDAINQIIEDYIKDYQQNPGFLADYQNFLQNKDPSKLKLFFKHNEAIMKMQIQNLKVKIDVLTGGKSAYQIDNKDREKGRAYKLGHKLDKLPRRAQTAGFVGLSIGTGLLTGGLGTVASAAIVTGVSAGSVGGLNALKKWTHYTKEQNTHEKNVATDYRNEQQKIKDRQEQALNGKRYSWKTYKAKRQLALYDQSTQENFEISNTITDTITDLCSQVRKLNTQEENYVKKNLIQGKVRLDYYRDIGHNFLASNEKAKIEKDMKRLEKAIILGANKLGISLADIASLQAKDDNGTDLNYTNIKKDLESSYNKSLIQFKRERRVLAAKYGVGTAVASAGMSLGMQYFMGAGVFADKPIPGTTTGLGTTETFDPGKHNLLDTGTSNSIHDTAQSITSNPNINSSSVVQINYGAGTDATMVIPGRLTEDVYNAKIQEVINNINGMKGLNTTIRDQLIDHVKSQPRKASRATSNFTNDLLHGMRCSEVVEQAARGLADSGYNHGVKIAYDSSYDIIGKGIHNVSERVANADFVLNNPGTGNSFWERLVIPVPLWFNTFKDKILGKKKEDKKSQDKKPVGQDKKPEDKKIDKPKDKTPEDKKPDPSKPIDPTKDPDDYYKDDIGRKKLEGKGKIRTRGQKIDKIDKSDFGKEYPGLGKLQSPKDSANGLLKAIIADPKFIEPLYKEDATIISKMIAEGTSNDDIIEYIEKIIQTQRQETKNKESERAYNLLLDHCYGNIPEYLKEIFGEKIKEKFSDLPNKNRVHLVGEYDYLAIAGNRSSGVFRTEKGDIYISKEAIQQFENNPPIGYGKNGEVFPRVYREIKHLLVHELLHSMSIINYNDNNENNEKNMNKIGTRRIGLLNINYKSLNYSGRGVNEGTTENLTLEILKRRYEREGCINYKAPRESYRQERKIIQKIIEVDKTNLNRIDFQKTMLLRKYGNEENVERKTPLVELMRKMNGGKEINNSPRPYYYQIITKLLDYVNNYKTFEEDYGIKFDGINFILDFIEKKDISIIKKNFGKNLKIVFYDKTLLNTDKTDFNKTILDGYSGKIK